MAAASASIISSSAPESVPLGVAGARGDVSRSNECSSSLSSETLAMRNSLAARASCGVLLAAALARNVDAGRDELASVRAADGADDASVSAAEGAEDASVCAADADEDIDEAIVSGGVAAVAEELIVTEDAIVRDEGILRAWARSTCRDYG